MLQTLGWLAALGLATATAAGREPVEGRDPQWHASLAWQGQAARVESAADGGWLLRSPTGTRHIAPQRMASDTASPLFDGLFAMAQAEMEEDKVDAITDWSFNHQQPFPCACFETGEKWHYVWTRDLSYAADLALARLDPERTKTSLRFKLSGVRAPGVPQGLYVAQDTGSGGSWPISTDRVVWFLAARHLLDDRAFADEAWRALVDTLAQDRAYVFDESMGPIRRGRRRKRPSSRSRSRCRRMSCITKRCDWRQGSRANATMPMHRVTRAKPMR